MKNKFNSLIVLVLSVVLIFYTCKKQKPPLPVVGNYNTTFMAFTVDSVPGDTNTFAGEIIAVTDNNGDGIINVSYPGSAFGVIMSSGQNDPNHFVNTTDNYNGYSFALQYFPANDSIEYSSNVPDPLGGIHWNFWRGRKTH